MFKTNVKQGVSPFQSWMPVILTLWVAWFLLIQRLGGPSFWIDEMLSFNRASLGDWQSFYAELLGANHAPLYEGAFLHPWLLLGDGEFWARFPGVLLAMLTVGLTYRLGRQANGVQTGILGIIFLVFSPLFFQHVREVRPYSLLVLTVTLTVYFWWRAMRSGRYLFWMLFTLSGAASLYTHYYAGFALMGIGVTTLVAKVLLKLPWRRVYQAAFAFVGIALLFLPWLPTFLAQLQSGAVSWIPPLSLWTFFELPAFFFAHTLFTDTVWSGIVVVTWLLFLAAFILLWQSQQQRKPLLILLALFFFSFLAVALASLQKPLMVPRYFVSLSPIVALISAYTIVWLVAQKKAPFLIIPIGLLIVGGYSVYKLTYLDRTPPWRSAALYIEEMAEPGDKVVLFSGHTGGAYLPLQYYLGESWPILTNDESLEDQGAVDVTLAGLAPARRVWLIQSTRKTPSRSLNYQPNVTYGPYVLESRKVFDELAIKPHLSVDLWLLVLE
ncbi:MAG: glycosyltransferase family 39 protein [Ardenticatenaceae bacterium]|nr:glycosyltransferase family 39 protein [Anaerolineales bacterium]MCB8974809.1 glycosyltransferase family 39 protein [Ardenticatenaceae bacterium]